MLQALVIMQYNTITHHIPSPSFEIIHQKQKQTLPILSKLGRIAIILCEVGIFLYLESRFCNKNAACFMRHHTHFGDLSKYFSHMRRLFSYMCIGHCRNCGTAMHKQTHLPRKKMYAFCCSLFCYSADYTYQKKAGSILRFACYYLGMLCCFRS